MRARALPFDLELTDAQGRKMGEGRGVGLHLGEVIKHMRVHVHGEQLDGKGGFVRMALGFIFEIMLEHAFAIYMGFQRNVVRPDEVQVDGIFMNADAINVDDGYLEDYKVTWVSRRKIQGIGTEWTSDDELLELIRKHFWHWLVQLRSYARAYGTRKARLLVFFVSGDYSFKPPFGEPHIVNLELEFTQEELDNNWAMVTQYAGEEMKAA